MLRVLVCTLALIGSARASVILDRVAVVVNDRVVKDSDIDRDIRTTAFINGEPLVMDGDTRRKAAARLIEQTLIRREVELAHYPPAADEETANLLGQIRRQRYPNEAAFNAALKQYGITEAELRKQLSWQITVLHFIEQRFRPGVLVSDEEVERYFEQHKGDFQQSSRSTPVLLEKVRGQIEDQIAGERVNQEFFKWLDEARRQSRIDYRERALQ